MGHEQKSAKTFESYLTLALAGARSLTSSGNLSISFIQTNTILHRYLINLKLYKIGVK